MWRRIDRLALPASTVSPLLPFPWNALFRWALLGLFAFYLLGSGIDFGSLRVLGVAVALVGTQVLTTLLFFFYRRGDAGIWRVQALVLPLDCLLLALAVLLDPARPSVAPLLAAAIVVVASVVFRPRYVLGLAAFAAAATAGAQLLEGGQAWFAFLTSTVILSTGYVVARRSGSEARLRQDLLDSHARECAQSESLRAALRDAQLSEARFAAFSQQAPVILALFDRSGELTFASRRLAETFGIAVPGRRATDPRWSDVLTDDDRARIRSCTGSALAGETATLDFTMLDPAGNAHALTGFFFPIADGAGAVIQDLTREHALQAQVERAQQLETVGILAGGIAHDFNNLLTAILGNLYLARQQVGADSQATALIAEAMQAAERGAELVRSLLNYSKPGLDGAEFIPLDRLIEETAALARRGLTPHVELVVETGPEPGYVFGNFSALQQVLMNLLVNGRDAMPAGGRLTVARTSVHLATRHRWGTMDIAPGDYHLLIVADTGSGIDPNVMPHIFDPFMTTKDKSKGTGLGLSTAQGSVRAHGGWLDAISTPGVGSTFRVLLPAARPAVLPLEADLAA